MQFGSAGEYRPFGEIVLTLRDLRDRLVKAGPRGRLAIVFAPSHDPALMGRQFDMLCQLVYLAGSITLVAEELSDVTQPAGRLQAGRW